MNNTETKIINGKKYVSRTDIPPRINWVTRMELLECLGWIDSLDYPKAEQFLMEKKMNNWYRKVIKRAISVKQAATSVSVVELFNLDPDYYEKDL